MGLKCGLACYKDEYRFLRIYYDASASAVVIELINIAMNELVPYMVNKNQWNWGLETGWFYAGIGLPFVIGTWLLIPETSG